MSSAHMLASTTAALLRAVLGLRPASLVATATSLLGLYLGAAATALLLACVLLLLPVLYLMLRIELDARLFEQLAAQTSPSETLEPMDRALQALGLVSNPVARPLEARVQGTRRLIMRALVAVGLQLALLCAAAVAMALN
ncbi:MAG TPA: hypothetical protein VLC92_01700 [Rhodocyclaceae bacterium]|nr:hypothetical protein [Rhodocyclaceae bacterium]